MSNQIYRITFRKFFGHLHTISHHKWLVMRGCFAIGLYRQALLHDLSKYAPTEFLVGARYYIGTRSPNAVEREEKGYSEAWMHHKGRNRHHFEYWTDFNRETGQYDAVPMPNRYLAEMVIDRIAASKTYLGSKYDDGAPLAYYERAKESPLLHPETAEQLTQLLNMLKERGEAETLRFIRREFLR